MNAMPDRQPPDREPLPIPIPSDLLELFHSGFHSSALFRSTLDMSAKRQVTIGRSGGASSRRRSGASSEHRSHNLYEPEVITFDELLARAEWHVSLAEGNA